MPTDVFRVRCTAHGMAGTTGKRRNKTAKAETEVKEAMKKSLDEPGAPTEHRLLARQDEPAVWRVLTAGPELENSQGHVWTAPWRSQLLCRNANGFPRDVHDTAMRR